MKADKGSVFRIAMVNPGGLTCFTQSDKSRRVVKYVTAIGADAIGLTETNVNWTKVEASNRLHERFHGVWRRCSFNIAHYADYQPKKEPKTRGHQWGGVTLCSIDEASSRKESSGVDPSGLGRWAWTRYQGKDGYALRVLMAYRCNKKTEYSGSVYNQQKSYFDSINDQRNPREAFWEDLMGVVKPWMETTDAIIVCMDMNDDVRDKDNIKHLTQLHLTEIITHKHGPDAPNTHASGSAPIDGIFVSPGLLSSHCGYLPFEFDHRLLWIDLDLQTTFGYEPDIAPRFKPNRLQYHDRRCRNRYLQRLSDLLFTETDFGVRLTNFYQTIQQGAPLTPEQLLIYDHLLREHLTAARLAESCCRHLYTGRQAWTPDFTKNRNTRLFWLRLLARRKGRHVNSRYLQRLAKKAGVVTPLHSLTEMDAIEGLRVANSACKMYAKLHLQKRETFLQNWAEAEAAALNITTEAALRRRLREEKERIGNRIIQQCLGKGLSSGVPRVLVTNPTGVVECTSKQETEAALLHESNLRFRQASSTPALTHLFPYLGLTGTTPHAEQILQGSFQPPPETDYWTTQWLKEMARPLDYEAMPMARTLDDFTAGWTKAKDRTSSSPFGLRFTNYKVQALDTDLATVDFQLATIALQTGASPPHWQQGMNAWILKKPEEYRVEKMRTILLYDAAFNQNNKWTGRAAMAHAEHLQRRSTTTERQPLAPEQYGSCKAHQSIDQCLNKRLTLDLSRMLHKPMALLR